MHTVYRINEDTNRFKINKCYCFIIMKQLQNCIHVLFVVLIR